MKKRFIACLVLVAATALTVFYTFSVGETVATTTILGSFAATLTGFIAIKIIKDNAIFYSILAFIFFASPLGSVVNLYRKMDSYDKVVHFFSGILLASVGLALMKWIVAKYEIACASAVRLSLLAILFAFFFSSACAGIWEIFEFAADRMAGGEMQRGMVDTVTDMIAGNAGAITFCLYSTASACGIIKKKVQIL